MFSTLFKTARLLEKGGLPDEDPQAASQLLVAGEPPPARAEAWLRLLVVWIDRKKGSCMRWQGSCCVSSKAEIRDGEKVIASGALGDIVSQPGCLFEGTARQCGLRCKAVM